jgi:hypothetical protein
VAGLPVGEEMNKEWQELARLLELGDMKVFWTYYADYLVRMNIISNARRIIYAAARKTVEVLDAK